MKLIESMSRCLSVCIMLEVSRICDQVTGPKTFTERSRWFVSSRTPLTNTLAHSWSASCNCSKVKGTLYLKHLQFHKASFPETTRRQIVTAQKMASSGAKTSTQAIRKINILTDSDGSGAKFRPSLKSTKSPQCCSRCWWISHICQCYAIHQTLQESL